MIIEKDGTIVTVHTRFEQQTESIKSMIRRVNCLSDELISFQDNWKRTCEILEVEDLLRFGRNKEEITDKDFLERIKLLRSEIEDVKRYLEKVLRFMER